MSIETHLYFILIWLELKKRLVAQYPPRRYLTRHAPLVLTSKVLFQSTVEDHNNVYRCTNLRYNLGIQNDKYHRGNKAIRNLGCDSSVEIQSNELFLLISNLHD